MKKIKLKYCCDILKENIEDIGMPLHYFPVTREYGLETQFEEYPVGKESKLFMKYSSAIYLLPNCSNCGIKLPESLRNTYIDILKNEYNIEPPFDDNQKIPKEFKSDEWWKKRGL